MAPSEQPPNSSSSSSEVPCPGRHGRADRAAATPGPQAAPRLHPPRLPRGVSVSKCQVRQGRPRRVPLASHESPCPRGRRAGASSGTADVCAHLLPLPLPAAGTAEALVGGDLPQSPRTGGRALRKFHRLGRVSQFLVCICGGSATAMRSGPGPWRGPSVWACSGTQGRHCTPPPHTHTLQRKVKISTFWTKRRPGRNRAGRSAPGGARSFYSPPTRGQFPGRRATR